MAQLLQQAARSSLGKGTVIQVVMVHNNKRVMVAMHGRPCLSVSQAKLSGAGPYKPAGLPAKLLKSLENTGVKPASGWGKPARP